MSDEHIIRATEWREGKGQPPMSPDGKDFVTYRQFIAAINAIEDSRRTDQKEERKELLAHLDKIYTRLSEVQSICAVSDEKSMAMEQRTVQNERSIREDLDPRIDALEQRYGFLRGVGVVVMVAYTGLIGWFFSMLGNGK